MFSTKLHKEITMSKTHLVWSCAHAKPETGNERFDWLGKFIYDLKPDMVIDLGDGADMSRGDQRLL